MNLGRMVGACVVAGVLATSACAARQDADVADPDRSTTTIPAPVPGTFDEVYSAGDISAEIRGVRAEAKTPYERAQIAVEVRSTSRSVMDQSNPHIELVCSDQAVAGDWMSGSTWEANGVLRSDAVLSGEVLLGLPISDVNPEYPALTCADPAVRMILRDVRRAITTVVLFPLDPAVIEAAVRAPAAAPLPLPYAGT